MLPVRKVPGSSILMLKPEVKTVTIRHDSDLGTPSHDLAMWTIDGPATLYNYTGQ